MLFSFPPVRNFFCMMLWPIVQSSALKPKRMAVPAEICRLSLHETHSYLGKTTIMLQWDSHYKKQSPSYVDNGCIAQSGALFGSLRYMHKRVWAYSKIEELAKIQEHSVRELGSFNLGTLTQKKTCLQDHMAQYWSDWHGMPLDLMTKQAILEEVMEQRWGTLLLLEKFLC